MGASSAKQTPEYKANKLNVQQQVKTHNKQSLQTVHEHLDQKFRNDEIGREAYFTAKSVVERGEKLVDRGGKNLVKDDYIAIIIALKPEYVAHKHMLCAKTNDELIFMIRSVIYNVQTIMEKINGNEHNMLRNNEPIVAEAIVLNEIPDGYSKNTELYPKASAPIDLPVNLPINLPREPTQKHYDIIDILL